MIAVNQLGNILAGSHERLHLAPLQKSNERNDKTQEEVIIVAAGQNSILIVAHLKQMPT